VSKSKNWKKKYKIAFILGGSILSIAALWGKIGSDFWVFPLRSLFFFLVIFVIGGFISIYLVAMETSERPPPGYH